MEKLNQLTISVLDRMLSVLRQSVNTKFDRFFYFYLALNWKHWQQTVQTVCERRDSLNDILLYTGATFIILFLVAAVFKRTWNIARLLTIWQVPFSNSKLQITVYSLARVTCKTGMHAKRRACVRLSVRRNLLGNPTAVPSGYIIKTSQLTADILFQRKKQILNNWLSLLWIRYIITYRGQIPFFIYTDQSPRFVLLVSLCFSAALYDFFLISFSLNKCLTDKENAISILKYQPRNTFTERLKIWNIFSFWYFLLSRICNLQLHLLPGCVSLNFKKSFMI